MANVNAPMGLVPYASAGGASPPTFVTTPVVIAYNASAIYKGDPVKAVNDGTVARWTATTGAPQLVGVFWGCEYLSVSRGYTVQSPYWPGSDVASTQTVTGFVIPCDAANPQWFVLQMNATGATIADVNNNIDLTMTAGSTTTGWSAAVGDSGTINTTLTLPFKIKQLYRGIDNTGTGVYAKLIVAANITGTTGI
mgnify:CR=1 FL=1